MNQLERLQELKKRFVNKEDLKKPIHEIWLKKLEILEKNPQYMGKLDHFEKNQLYATSNKDIIFFIEVGRLKR